MGEVILKFYLGYEIRDGAEVLKKEECYRPFSSKAQGFGNAYYRVCRDMMEIIQDYVHLSRERRGERR